MATLPRTLRCAANAKVAAEHPEAIVDCRMSVRLRSDAWENGEVVAYAAKRRQHVLKSGTGSDSVQLLDLSTHAFLVQPVHTSIVVHDKSVLAKQGTHIKACAVCFETLDIGNQPAEFCFQTFRVDAHSIEQRGPRHPNRLCGRCLRTHCELALSEGKLYVRCPMPNCGRALQTRELQDIVSETAYTTLMTRLREAEDQEQHQQDAGEVASAGLELRLCPQCKVRIEKNEGCPSMQCYRCGHNFTWGTAQLLEAPAVPTLMPASPEETPFGTLPAGLGSAVLFGWAPAGHGRGGARGHKPRRTPERGADGYPGSSAGGSQVAQPPALLRVDTNDL